MCTQHLLQSSLCTHFSLLPIQTCPRAQQIGECVVVVYGVLDPRGEVVMSGGLCSVCSSQLYGGRGTMTGTKERWEGEGLARVGTGLDGRKETGSGVEKRKRRIGGGSVGGSQDCGDGGQRCGEESGAQRRLAMRGGKEWSRENELAWLRQGEEFSLLMLKPHATVREMADIEERVVDAILEDGGSRLSVDEESLKTVRAREQSDRGERQGKGVTPDESNSMDGNDIFDFDNASDPFLLWDDVLATDFSSGFDLSDEMQEFE